jgi:hypothetical protein
VTKSLTVYRTTVETDLGKYASSFGPVVTSALAFGCATVNASCGIITVSCIPAMSLCYTLGSSTDLTGLRNNTGSFHPVVTGSSSLCLITGYAILSTGASCIDPGVTYCLTADLAAKLTGSSIFTISYCPVMLKSIAFSFVTNGTGLGSRTGSIGPLMAECLAFGLTALTSLGRLAGSVCPYVLVSANDANNLVLDAVKSAGNRLGKHVTRSEREQKDH